MTRNQLNARVTPQVETVIDARRIELAKTLETIPTRSDMVRLALEACLGIRFDEPGSAQRAASAKKSRRTQKPR